MRCIRRVKSCKVKKSKIPRNNLKTINTRVPQIIGFGGIAVRTIHVKPVISKYG
jgi:hypothetical protein